MSDNARSRENQEFVETCYRLGLLTEHESHELIASLDQKNGGEGKFASQLAVQRGLLTATEVDIVHSLQQPTSIVPGYEILDVIGRGGMGVVYRAKQIDLERIVALKTILIGSADLAQSANRLEREAKGVARLQHPNIVQALNFGNHNGRYFFAMEYAAGRTCEQAVSQEGPMPSDVAWSIVRQVASGLLHALHHGLIHRDIKPANLILVQPPEGSTNRKEIVKIADFGLAMLTEPAERGDERPMRLTTGGHIMGSPAYMSLEQFGGSEVDFRSDIYSLGATAWHLLLGEPPYDGVSVTDVYRQKTQPFVVDPSTLPIRLDQLLLLQKLLDSDPDQRIQSYEELIAAIDGLKIDGFVASKTSDFAHTPPYGSGAVEQVQGLGTPTSVVLSSSFDSMQETIDQAALGTDSTRVRRRWLWPSVVGMAILMLVAAIAGGTIGTPEEPGLRNHTVVAGGVPLFDGVSLSGWGVDGSMVGSWNTVTAPDGSNAIACTESEGAITRRIPSSEPSKNRLPRIQIFVWLQERGGPVDIDFAHNSAEWQGLRGTIRLSGTTIQVGTKRTDFGDLDVFTETPAPASVFERFHVVNIERQPTDWYVFFEEKFVGSIPLDQFSPIGQKQSGGAAEPSDAIRLVVHRSEGDTKAGANVSSQAYFADVQLYELAEPDLSLQSKTDLLTITL